MSTKTDQNSLTTRVAAANIVVALVVITLKYVAYVMSGSIALYSDALESVVNVMTAIAAYGAIRLSAVPPDSDHPFGHHKAEFLAAMFEGAMIAVAAVLIMIKAYTGLTEGVTLEHSTLGLTINGFASAINAAWAAAMIRWGTAWRSPALVADGQHLFTDVITSVGVVIGLIFAVISGWSILDPLIAAVVAVNILMMGYKIAIDSMSRLMDQAASPDMEARIRGAIEANGMGALQAHDIRTRQAGRALFIEFHLVVPGSMTVDEAHAICDRLEDSIETNIEGSEVVIHVEPDHKAKPEDSGAVPL
ncbi:cation diffusion facilitator family transporter [Hyphomicrobium sp.]|uniref:cation diffusion facilitator family transporter n=1 Tax=Hyphomicrobium sp. TaxID=82 RepID=UPI000FBF9C5F|nr:cation diffusion facilitator family transporter [Hyphomicrobium sp.]RUO99764.1 MAG: cation transporter [Hyphomicrobium sp.]